MRQRLKAGLAAIANMDQTLLIISGPTAVGKSALALALAKRLSGEIISCDSVQVYRGFDIGSAKPTRAEQSEVPHHLIDICDPDEQYQAARFRDDCINTIAEVRNRGNLPIVVGGTTLYLSALLSGLSDLPDRDQSLRTDLLAMSNQERLELLGAKDPHYAKQVHENDTLRIVRALEIILMTGKSLAESQQQKMSGGEPISAVVLNLTLPRDQLRARIAARTEQMLNGGLFEEVQALLSQHSENVAPFSTVGYREIISYLKSELSQEQVADQITIATRQLAKRQRTFWRNEPVKREWYRYPQVPEELSREDVIHLPDQMSSRKTQVIQRGFTAYHWNLEQIVRKVRELLNQEEGVTVYSVSMRDEE